MPRYRLTVEYDGRPYRGFQAQAALPSVQASIERAVEAFCGQALRLQAAGRTPADVDLIVVGTTTPDLTFPAVATMVHRLLLVVVPVVIRVLKQASPFLVPRLDRVLLRLLGIPIVVIVVIVALCLLMILAAIRNIVVVVIVIVGPACWLLVFIIHRLDALKIVIVVVIVVIVASGLLGGRVGFGVEQVFVLAGVGL